MGIPVNAEGSIPSPGWSGSYAYNFSRAAGILAAGRFTRAKMVTLRTKLILVQARIASSARTIKIHLPENWPSAQTWTQLFTNIQAPPQMA
ncbi:hypothetical protein ACIPVK_02610 [Paeniglutamicibacter sp. MACA_103]|uniref:hypothetical protein n=1 Tax=Paeniglutamicibacter sp. MACA_103 TaxID=3377337 RepID=UPI003893413F